MPEIKHKSWIGRRILRFFMPYLRLARVDRPIGTWLLLLPCWWSITLAFSNWPDAWLIFLFAAGSLIMRGAGCTLNDIVDREIDGHVLRTASRPIPSGQISIFQAIIFLSLQLICGLYILLQFFHPYL